MSASYAHFAYLLRIKRFNRQLLKKRWLLLRKRLWDNLMWLNCVNSHSHFNPHSMCINVRSMHLYAKNKIIVEGLLIFLYQIKGRVRVVWVSIKSLFLFIYFTVLNCAIWVWLKFTIRQITKIFYGVAMWIFPFVWNLIFLMTAAFSIWLSVVMSLHKIALKEFKNLLLKKLDIFLSVN